MLEFEIHCNIWYLHLTSFNQSNPNCSTSDKLPAIIKGYAWYCKKCYLINHKAKLSKSLYITRVRTFRIPMMQRRWRRGGTNTGFGFIGSSSGRCDRRRFGGRRSAADDVPPPTVVVVVMVGRRVVSRTARRDYSLFLFVGRTRVARVRRPVGQPRETGRPTARGWCLRGRFQGATAADVSLPFKLLEERTRQNRIEKNIDSLDTTETVVLLNCFSCLHE